jgi:hypothetical protein
MISPNNAKRDFCAAGRRPGQLTTGETRTTTTLLYDDSRSALVNVNHENVTGDHYARLRVDGSRGSVRQINPIPTRHPRSPSSAQNTSLVPSTAIALDAVAFVRLMILGRGTMTIDTEARFRR